MTDTVLGVPADMDVRGRDDREAARSLLDSIKIALPKLVELLARYGDHWNYEDPIYRYYHQSFKVYYLQDATEEIVAALRELAPNLPLNEWFLQIVKEGTGKSFVPEHNREWQKVTRPILEAFFHARYFLDMVVRYGKQLEYPPSMLPSGWASVLYLYGLR
jgi:hypothetical protein